MTRAEFQEIEQFMARYMHEAIHNRDHVYRVLYAALDIAQCEAGVDMDVLICACLLHDIGREAQSKDPALDHAEIGGDIARGYLEERGFSAARAGHVSSAIKTHRYRRNNPPTSIEAKILFDADKLDAAGALGIARTLGYGGLYGEPMYAFSEDGALLTKGDGAEFSTFLQEYDYKLKNVYDRFYTARAAEIARGRQQTAVDFYERFVDEITACHKNGEAALKRALIPGDGMR